MSVSEHPVVVNVPEGLANAIVLQRAVVDEIHTLWHEARENGADLPRMRELCTASNWAQHALWTLEAAAGYPPRVRWFEAFEAARQRKPEARP